MVFGNLNVCEVFASTLLTVFSLYVLPRIWKFISSYVIAYTPFIYKDKKKSIVRFFNLSDGLRTYEVFDEKLYIRDNKTGDRVNPRGYISGDFPICPTFLYSKGLIEASTTPMEFENSILLKKWVWLFIKNRKCNNLINDC